MKRDFNMCWERIHSSDEGDEYNDEDDEDESFYEVIDSFDAQEDDDLSVKPGEVVCVIHKQ